MKIKLSARLRAVARMVGQCRCLGDIGTDHGHLCIYMVQNGMSQTAIAADSNMGPLSAAATNVKGCGLSNKITILQSDGLAAFAPGQCDVFVMAGMGGELIANIISKGSALSDETLVLQPMTAVYELRKFLTTNGFKIACEALAVEGRKVYNVLLAQRAAQTEVYSEVQLFAGRYILENNPPHKQLYLSRLAERCEKIINGAKKANACDFETVDYYERMLVNIRDTDKAISQG